MEGLWETVVLTGLVMGMWVAFTMGVIYRGWKNGDW
jgi:hypothetical protein